MSTGGRATAGVLFTDLDGTILDFETHEPSPESVEATGRLAGAGIAVVPVTSKTAAEVRRLRAILPFGPVAVVEGGAVLLPSDGEPELLGPPRPELIGILQRLQDEGYPLRGLHEMDAAELAGITGLRTGAAARALDRLASEPFVVTGPVEEDFEEELGRRVSGLGYGLVRGGRLWHLLGKDVDKGSAVREVLRRHAELSHGPSGAVGDAWNDLPMLSAVHHGYLLGDAVAEEDVPPGVERIGDRGPAGFVRAADRFLVVVAGVPG